MSTPVLIFTGPVGAGKTTTASAASELLEETGIPHALIDMDHLRNCIACPERDPFHMLLGFQNVAALWQNYHAYGAQRLIVADVVETRENIAQWRNAIPNAGIKIVRLDAGIDTLHRRLAERGEVGASLQWHQARAIELRALMGARRLEDALIHTEGRTPREVAREALERFGWL